MRCEHKAHTMIIEYRHRRMDWRYLCFTYTRLIVNHISLRDLVEVEMARCANGYKAALHSIMKSNLYGNIPFEKVRLIRINNTMRTKREECTGG